MVSTVCSTLDTCTTSSMTSTRTSTTALLALIDWKALPAETRQTIRTLGPLMQEGCSQKEMARRLQLPESTVAAMRKRMADAILAQCRAQAEELEPAVRALVERLAG